MSDLTVLPVTVEHHREPFGIGEATPRISWVTGTDLADWLVPYDQSEQLHAALTAAGVACRLEPVEGAQHIFDGCDDVDAVVQLSVDHLANALLP